MITKTGKVPTIAILLALSVVLLSSSCINPKTNQPATSKKTQALSEGREAGLAEQQNTTASIEVNAIIIDDAREANLLDQVMQGVNSIYQQCGISVSYQSQQVDLTAEQVIDRQTRTSLVEQY